MARLSSDYAANVSEDPLDTVAIKSLKIIEKWWTHLGSNQGPAD